MELAARFFQVGDGQAQITLGRVERAMTQDVLPWRRLAFGKDWGHRDPLVVKLKVLSPRRRMELLRLLRRRRSRGAKNLPPSAGAQHLL